MTKLESMIHPTRAKLYLVGAGPGDSRLINVSRLRSDATRADVVGLRPFSGLPKYSS